MILAFPKETKSPNQGAPQHRDWMRAWQYLRPSVFFKVIPWKASKTVPGLLRCQGQQRPCVDQWENLTTLEMLIPNPVFPQGYEFSASLVGGVFN